jgi:hypothetical protein
MTSNQDPRTDYLKIGALSLSAVFNVLQLVTCVVVLYISVLLFFWGRLSFLQLFYDGLDRRIYMK